MKTNPKQRPDLESIIGNLNGSAAKGEIPIQDDSQQSKFKDRDSDHEGRLWEEFMDILNDDEDSDIDRTKLYAIDDDIVETLHQCSFGKANVHVINSILRTFLIDNLSRLREMHRPRSKSLLDKYD